MGHYRKPLREGDNLEVLKLLQESYLGKVKMIYIDESVAYMIQDVLPIFVKEYKRTNR